MLTLNVLAFIACLYIVRGHCERPIVVDALAANWFACQAVVILNAGYGRPEVFIAADVVTGVFLAAYAQGHLARQVASLYIPMFFINGFRYVVGDQGPQFLTVSLDILAWSQLLIAYIGGASGALATMDSSVRDRRGLLARTHAAIWGRE